MNLTKIAARELETEPAQEAEEHVIREFGKKGKIKVLALETGEVLASVGDHRGMGNPGEGWWASPCGATYDPPVFCRSVPPSMLKQVVQQAHDAADKAITREAKAKQAAESL